MLLDKYEEYNIDFKFHRITRTISNHVQSNKNGLKRKLKAQWGK